MESVSTTIVIALATSAAIVSVLLLFFRFSRRSWTEQDHESDGERLRILTDSIQDIVLELDDQGTILFVSDNLREVAGIAPEKLLGRSASSFTSFLRDSPAGKSLAEGGRMTEESIAASVQPQVDRLVMPDGSERWFESTGKTYRTSYGEVRILACVRNVTYRVEQEARSKENELRLNRGERVANLGSWEFYPANGKVVWSDQMFRLHGLPIDSDPPDVEGLKAFVHPDDYQRLIDSARDRRTPVEIRHRIRRADNGEIRNLVTRVELDRDEKGMITRVIAASMDVTNQSALEERRRRGQQHFRAFVDSNIVGVFYVDHSRMITQANDAFLSLLHFTGEDLPLDWKDLTPPEGVLRDDLAGEEFLTTGVALPYEKEFLSKSGECVTMLIGSAAIEPSMAIVIAVDLSEQKRAAAYVSRYQRELEDTIAERTLELMKSRDRLIKNDRLAAIGTLAAGVAHQINNPIGAILNSAEFALLCRGEPDSKAAFERALNVNLTEARRCAQIVKSMLLFSRDERAERWPEDLGSVVRRAHRAISPLANDRSASVTLRVEEQAVLSLISPIEIEQAIVNVMRNAIESREEGASISLSLTKRDKSAEIEILDDGRGIPAEEIDRLFEPFYSTRTHDGGTGLGLSVAHGILTDHGGEIRIDSIPGEGTRVLILLPLVDSDAN